MRTNLEHELDKPDDMFDRDVEWMELAAFASDARPGAALGVVSGRRRQGKTFLLRALCEATGGFYFAAEEATDGESLQHLGSALGAHLKLPSALHFSDWREAVDALLSLGAERSIPVAIDEFPYLARANSALPSIIQNAIAPRRPEREGSRSRLLLCGSAMTFMGTLLSGNAPLRGRAGLELVVPTLDYQLAAQFWNITDPTLAIKVHAIVGGTPAYRREFARDDTPADTGDFDSWVQRTVLNPASPLFREARYLLAAEAELHDMGLYHSVLAAIADGNTTRGNIAKYIGRKSGDLAHPLNVLMDCGLVYRRSDAFRENQATYEIAEPLITFYHAVMRPIWSDLAHTRNPARLWQRSQSRYTSNVLGSHFEQLARHWTRYFAPEETVGGFPSRVEPGTVNDPASKKIRQVDVVALGPDDDNRESVLAIGEAKWHEAMGMPHLEGLRHIRGLLTAQRRRGAATARMLCFSGAGFTPELIREASRTRDVRLLTPADLYAGVLLYLPAVDSLAPGGLLASSR
jgi:AAA+ ATPase superfamily predicted ATPase